MTDTPKEPDPKVDEHIEKLLDDVKVALREYKLVKALAESEAQRFGEWVSRG